MHHGPVDSAVPYRAIRQPPHLELKEARRDTHVCGMGGEKAPTGALDPIVLPDIALRVNEGAGGLDLVELPEDVLLIVGRFGMQAVLPAQGPTILESPCARG